MPQKSTATGDKPPKLLPQATAKDKADHFLPPKAESKKEISAEADAAHEPVNEIGESLGNQGIAESEKVLLPDGQGGFIEVSERKTTVNYRGAKIELESLKREEKEVSRTLKNFIVFTLCVLLLIGLMITLSWYSST